MAFLKAIWKGHKHKKLSDEWDLAPMGPEPANQYEQHPGSTLEGITFNVKYLGSTFISSPSDPKATAEAVKSIVAIAKSTGRKGTPVQFAINLRGVSVMELETKKHTLDISLYRISYCSADATYGHVFAFISTNENDTMECHAFLCQKRKMAQLISITVAQTFNTAYHLWQITHSGPGMSAGNMFTNNRQGSMPEYIRSPNAETKKPCVLQKVLAPLPMLIDLTTPIEEKKPPSSNKKEWASFED